RETLAEAIIGGIGAGVADLLVMADGLLGGETRLLAPPRATGWHYALVRAEAARPDPVVERFAAWLSAEVEKTSRGLAALPPPAETI
ncbi:hypothetical protein R5H29_00870, partial [Stenotrophomonas sp. A3_2]